MICNNCKDKTFIGGSAITIWNCEVCHEQQISESTFHGKLCNECSDELNICSICGGKNIEYYLDELTRLSQELNLYE